MGIEWERQKLIYYSLKSSPRQPDQSCPDVTKHTEFQMSINHPASGINSSVLNVLSQPLPQDSVRNYSDSSIIHSLSSERTSIGNVETRPQIKQVNFEHERLRLEEKRLEFDMDLRERQYKLDMQRLEIERSGLEKVKERLEHFSAWMDRIETKIA
jgi:hypothetical protein